MSWQSQKSEYGNSPGKKLRGKQEARIKQVFILLALKNGEFTV